MTGWIGAPEFIPPCQVGTVCILDFFFFFSGEGDYFLIFHAQSIVKVASGQNTSHHVTSNCLTDLPIKRVRFYIGRGL